MNGRQAAKMASLRVAELERILALNKADIIDYNLCILSQIDGGDPCVFCEDYEECQLEAKGHGCSDWMMRSQMKRAATAAKAAEEAGDPDGEQGSETGIDSVQRVEEQ